ncbi:alpha/beta hydrolase [Actinomadura sp. K4S16]|uniref:alpha/beta hydrolase n=1 Tax=Actinomadura sp. K4S16 TaxID=1316147 RepID=UPI0011EBE9D4|nr:alpha/beta hydrolase [Actinomadura sp. K4S16]
MPSVRRTLAVRRPLPVRRSLAAVSVLAATGSATAAGHAEVYAPPAAAPALAPSALGARYETTGRDITRALATARRVHDEGRARVLAAFLAPDRRFLSFDPRGDGRAVEVLGDLEHADRIAVVVPGADNSLANYDSPKFVGGGSRALYRQARDAAPGARIAVIAWLGYDSPSTLSTGALTSGSAEKGARGLERLLTGVHRLNGRARFALLCHSYGSVVCGKAARRLAPLPVDEIALFGSPGTTVRHVSGLGTSARVWAGRSKGDWVRYVPHVRFAGLGFGADPVTPGFGALRFDAGTGPHSGYLKPGSLALRNLALIALGRDAEVTHA